jgi:cytochrome c-type biogenesis protein CcmH/NrfF
VRRRLALLAAALALGAPGAAVAAECPRTTLADVEDEVMCPVCGTPLELATEAPQAERERALVQRLVDDCRSKEEIKARLVAEFGEDVLATPGDDGFDLAAYVIPGLAVLAGVGAIAFAALRWRNRRPDEGDSRAPAEPAATSRALDADMERYDL